MLELLRSGLHAEFYRDFRNVLVPFMDPAVYGRSILENSSFIVSSANPDANIHGRGFVARLSGSTAEFVHILSLMTVGPQPFSMDENGQLQLQFRPALPAWLVTTRRRTETLWIDGEKMPCSFPANTFSFTFLGKTLVTYHSPSKRDTFGPKGVKPCSIRLSHGPQGACVEVEGNRITGKLAESVRKQEFGRIEIELA